MCYKMILCDNHVENLPAEREHVFHASSNFTCKMLQIRKAQYEINVEPSHLF